MCATCQPRSCASAASPRTAAEQQIRAAAGRPSRRAPGRPARSTRSGRYGCSIMTVRLVASSGNSGATSASSHQSVQRGSTPSTASGCRNPASSGDATCVGPLRAGKAASTKTEPSTRCSETPADPPGGTGPRCCARPARAARRSAASSTSSRTASTARGQYGGAPSPTVSRDGTHAWYPADASRSATGRHVDGPTDGLCTRTKTGFIPSSWHCASPGRGSGRQEPGASGRCARSGRWCGARNRR